MIKIVQGTFGYWNGTSVVPKTAKDSPLELDPGLEQRLVNKGVAVFVSAAVQSLAEPPSDPPTPGNNSIHQPDPPTPESGGDTPPDPSNGQSGEDSDDDLPAYDVGMKLEELKEIAVVYGVDASKMRGKADVVAAIDAVQVKLEQDPDDGETPPAVSAEPPVL